MFKKCLFVLALAAVPQMPSAMANNLLFVPPQDARQATAQRATFVPAPLPVAIKEASEKSSEQVRPVNYEAKQFLAQVSRGDAGLLQPDVLLDEAPKTQPLRVVPLDIAVPRVSAAEELPKAALNPSSAPAGERTTTDEIEKFLSSYQPCPADSDDEMLRNFTLHDVVSQAYQSNPEIRNAQAKYGEVRAGKEIAFSAFLPKVDMSNSLVGNEGNAVRFGVGANNTDLGYNVAQVQAQCLLWDFGKSLAGYEQSKILTVVAGLNYVRTVQTVQYDSQTAYYEVLLAKAQVKTARDAIVRAKEYYRVAKNRFDAGKIDTEAKLSAQLQVVKSQQELVSAIADVETSIAMVNRVVGCPLLENACIEDVSGMPEKPVELERWLQSGLARRPEMAASHKMITEAQFGIDAAKADYKPTIDFSGGYTNYAGDVQANNWEGGLNLTWNLYEGGARRGLTKQAKAQLSQAQANFTSVKNQVEYEIKSAYASYLAARHSKRLAETGIVVARERYRVVMNKFNVGTASATDVVDAQTELTEAEQLDNSALYSVYTELAKLSYAIANGE